MIKRVCSTPTGRPEGRGREVIAPSVKTTLMGERTRFSFLLASLADRGSWIEDRATLNADCEQVCKSGGVWLSAVESCKEQHGLMHDFVRPATAICMSCGDRISDGNPRSAIHDSRSALRSELPC